jgi:acetyl esterase/lipase
MRKTTASLIVALFATILVMYSLAAFAADRLPSGPTYKEVLVATVQDGGKPFQLRTNIYLPKGPAGAPTPLLLFIHGHGGAYNFSNGSRAYEFSIALADRGIAVATIDYRPNDPLPGEVYDVKAYVRWFRAKAKEYNIDPNRIGIWGTSRGGHLAALLATSGDVKELEGNVGGNLEQSSKVQCAAIYYPLTDLLYNASDLMARFPESGKGQSKNGLGLMLLGWNDPRGDAPLLEVSEKNDTASPLWKYVALNRLYNAVTHVTKDDPPVLIGHSSMDSVVAVEQSEKLYKKMIDNGVDASFYIWTKGAHGVVGTDIEAATSEWLAKKLLVDLVPKK